MELCSKYKFRGAVLLELLTCITVIIYIINKVGSKWIYKEMYKKQLILFFYFYFYFFFYFLQGGIYMKNIHKLI